MTRGMRVLPGGMVCACLDETGERKVRRYERCERCHALMEADAVNLADPLWRVAEAARRIADATEEERLLRYVIVFDDELGPLRAALADLDAAVKEMP